MPRTETPRHPPSHHRQREIPHPRIHRQPHPHRPAPTPNPIISRFQAIPNFSLSDLGLDLDPDEDDDDDDDDDDDAPPTPKSRQPPRTPPSRTNPNDRQLPAPASRTSLALTSRSMLSRIGIPSTAATGGSASSSSKPSSATAICPATSCAGPAPSSTCPASPDPGCASAASAAPGEPLGPGLAVLVGRPQFPLTLDVQHHFRPQPFCPPRLERVPAKHPHREIQFTLTHKLVAEFRCFQTARITDRGRVMVRTERRILARRDANGHVDDAFGSIEMVEELFGNHDDLLSICLHKRWYDHYKARPLNSFQVAKQRALAHADCVPSNGLTPTMAICQLAHDVFDNYEACTLCFTDSEVRAEEPLPGCLAPPVVTLTTWHDLGAGQECNDLEWGTYKEALGNNSVEVRDSLMQAQLFNYSNQQNLDERSAYNAATKPT
ncbi:unnamed protein product [Parascedosporium putredinis]|uniref:Uncharacterized protein n=1 Tax=Parascedosporium putredinis TaxID=1442378 RepID=A0A9P1ME19_9PEZI|nr:unnamed protein product [Parascedosporium putredinis]CAI8001784.1 unnamed protein product [Parascedosporium putredinis]